MNTTTKSERQPLVIKLGGEVIDNTEALRHIAANIATLQSQGRYDIIMVHGGGPQTNALCERLQIPIQKVSGRRITDKDTLDVVQMVVAGKVNPSLVAALQSAGASAVGLTGLDGGLVQAKKRPRKMFRDDKSGEKREVDFGYVGDVTRIQPALLQQIIDMQHIPVVACLGGSEGEIYNINADTVAAEIAVAIQAETLIYISGKPGVRKDQDNPNSLIPKLQVDQIGTLIEDRTVSEGMIPKLQTAGHAIRLGVKQIMMIDGYSPESTLPDALQGKFKGTLIY